MIVHTLKMCTFIFCAHLINNFLFFTGVELRHFFPSVRRSGCQVCVICNSNSFHSFNYIQTLHNDCSHIENVHLLFFAHFINSLTFFTGFELRHFFHPKCIGGVWFV